MFRALVVTAVLALVVAADAGAATLRIVRGTSVATATSAQQTFMRDRYFRAGATSPLGWFTNTWTRRHAFGLDPADVAAHPEWQLKDSFGAPVHVGSRVAGDFGNAAFRAWWIARTQAAVVGHRGVWIDDVFMERKTTASTGVTRTPIDPRTNATMTDANWQLYMADFMLAVRAALPGVEIVHDVLWYKGDSGNVLRELQAANYVSVDKGFNDATITYGTSTYGYERLAGWIEREQGRGGGVIFDGPSSTGTVRLYALASSLLVSNGASALVNDGSTAPDAFWTGYNVDLGAPSGARYASGNVWRRDFTGGFVLVNEPYRTTRTLTLPAGYQDLDGVPTTSITLAGGTGAVFVPTPPAPTPTPEVPVDAPPTAVAPPTPVTPVATPVAPSMPTSSGTGKARVSTVGKAGARAPSSTQTSVRGSRTRLSGRVRGAIAGTVRLVIERKRGSGWTVARRESVTVKRSGSFVKDIRALPSGTYRVRGSFQGTGTSQPSRSAFSSFRA